MSLITKIILSCSLSVISLILFLVFKGRERKFACLAMISSTIGDFFMTDFFKMGDISTYPGAAFFILAHILYIVCYIGASKKKGYIINNKGLKLGIFISILAASVLTILMLKKTGSIQGMYFPLLIYLAIIALNLCLQFSYGFNEKGARQLICLGMTLFIISDFTVFLPMLNIAGPYNDFVWYTYVPAQALCILFNSSFRKENN